MKILIYTPSILPDRHFGTDLEIAKNHLDSNDDVHFLVCDSSMQYCEQNLVHSLDVCIACIAKREYGFSLLNTDANKIHNISLHNFRKNISIPKFKNIKELGEFEYNGIDIGNSASSTIVSILRDSNPDLSTHEILVENMIITSISLYESAYSFFSEFKPDIIYIFNGRTISRRPVLRAAQSLKIKVFTQESAGKLENYDLFEDTYAHDLKYFKNKFKIETQDFRKNIGDFEIAKNWFDVRRKGSDQSWYSFTKEQEINKLPEGFDKSKVNIAIFNSSEDEVECFDEWKHNIFITQDYSLRKILKSITDEKYHFYLRVHPNLKDLDNFQNKNIKELNFPNLTIIPAESKIDSYYLLDNCNKSVHFGSTIGVEVTYYNKPSILLGVAIYEDFDSCYKPKSFEEAIDLIKDINLKPLPVEDALKYGFFQETAGIKYKYYEPTGILTGNFMNQSLNKYVIDKNIIFESANDFLRSSILIKDEVKNSPFVSVIIICINKLENVEARMRSIEELEYKNIELILVNCDQQIKNINVKNISSNESFDGLLRLALDICTGEYLVILPDEVSLFKFSLQIMVNKIVNTKQDLIYAKYFYASLEDSRFESLDIVENSSTSFILDCMVENSSFLANFIFKKSFFDNKFLKDNKYLNEFDFYTKVAKNIKSPEINRLNTPIYAIFNKFITKLSGDAIINLNDLFIEQLKDNKNISTIIEQLIQITEQFDLLTFELKIVILNIFNEIYKSDLVAKQLKVFVSRYNTKTKKNIDQKLDIGINLDLKLLESFFIKNNVTNNAIYIYDNRNKSYSKEYYNELDLLFYYSKKSNLLKDSYLINYCSWDFGYLSENWKQLFNNKIDQVWVPSQYVKDKLIASNVNSQKIYVLKEGIDTDFFKPLKEHNQIIENNQAFNFLFVGDLTNFKGIELLLDCFIDELKTDKNISLTVASKNIDSNLYILIKNKIEQLSENNKLKINLVENYLLDNEKLLDLYNSSDCLIYPYKIEGNGRIIMQAMSCQLPVIVTGGGVSLDFCNNANSYLINCEEVEYEDFSIKEFDLKENMLAFEPDKQHLKTLINDVYANQDQAKQKAKKARETILNNFTLKNNVQSMKMTLEKLDHKLIFRNELSHIIQNYFHDAEKAMVDEKYEIAEIMYSSLIIYDKKSEYYYKLGLSQYKQNKFEEAVDSLAESLEAGLLNYEICNLLALSLQNLGDDETAKIYFDKALNLI